MKDVHNDYKYDVELILYAFVNKFLSGKDLGKVKKKLKMTELGKSLMNDISSKDKAFIEHYGRLLFLAFIKPIINGIGFDFKEVFVSLLGFSSILYTF